jgi:ferredoxin-NADP reductase
VSSATGVTEPAALPHAVRWELATLSGKVREAATAYTLMLDVPSWPRHRAGQHLDVRLTAPDGYQAERSYSISSAPEDHDVSITVEQIEDGEVSTYLVDELRDGDQLELRGPIGGWFTWQAPDGGPLLLVAGGSGLAPLMAMIRHRAAAGSDVATRVLVSARSADDLLYAEELRELAASDPALEPFYTLTRSPPEGWTGYARRVDHEMLRQVAFDPAERPRTFVCGPTGFVEHAAELLVELGHDPATVKTERFGPSGGTA